MTRPRASAPPPKRFSVMPSMLGYEVIDSDGRPVALKSNPYDAQAASAELNAAVLDGPRALAIALGCTDD